MRLLVIAPERNFRTSFKIAVSLNFFDIIVGIVYVFCMYWVICFYMEEGKDSYSRVGMKSLIFLLGLFIKLFDSMSIYSGFATRSQEQYYDKILYNLISTLLLRLSKFYKREPVD